MKMKILGFLALVGISTSAPAFAVSFSAVALDGFGHVGGATSTSQAWADYYARSYCGFGSCQVAYRFYGPRYIAVAQSGFQVGVGDSMWSAQQAESNALRYCGPWDPRYGCRIILSWYAY